MAGRPPSADPKVALTIRLPRSVLGVWRTRAELEGVPHVRGLIEANLCEAVGVTLPPPSAPRSGVCWRCDTCGLPWRQTRNRHLGFACPAEGCDGYLGRSKFDPHVEHPR